MSDTMEICSGCGVVRVQQHLSCPRCATDYGYEGDATLRVPFRPSVTYWACVECTFKCRGCGFHVPLNQIDMDGVVLCVRCGLEQTFDVSQWEAALDHARGGGDLWNEDNRLWSRARNGRGENELAIVSSPGHPLCEKCRQPVAVASTEGGHSTVACVCGESAVYDLSSRARGRAPAVKAVIATEHRVDRKAAKVDQSATAIAVACPSCNAPLEPNDSSKFLTCTYCHTISRIPDRTWFRISGKDPQPEPMWLLFGAVAKTREDLGAVIASHELAHWVHATEQSAEHEEEPRERQPMADPRAGANRKS